MITCCCNSVESFIVWRPFFFEDSQTSNWVSQKRPACLRLSTSPRRLAWIGAGDDHLHLFCISYTGQSRSRCWAVIFSPQCHMYIHQLCLSSSDISNSCGQCESLKVLDLFLSVHFGGGSHFFHNFDVPFSHLTGPSEVH